MSSKIVYATDLTKADVLVLKELEGDIRAQDDDDILEKQLNGHGLNGQGGVKVNGKGNGNSTNHKRRDDNNNGQLLDAKKQEDGEAITEIRELKDPTSGHFEPTVFTTIDLSDVHLPPVVDKYLFQPYVSYARRIVRVETDVVFITHILLYFATSVPSALFLYLGHFTWLHGILHFLVSAWYAGSYTLMMHQHIHGRGVLTKESLPARVFDTMFPYILDPLMGHTWNTYFYHHVKHHHVEGNGPDDLSSTIRFQRDYLPDFAMYVARFYVLIWLDLPLYFLRKGRNVLAAKAAFWELGNYAFIWTLWTYAGWRPTLCVVVLPLMVMRLGMMVGNWGQHAFVDEVEPDSDFRSSITLVDVPSNRYCFNDGYHTSHHLNPMRHWRDHPVAFLKAKDTYAEQGALVFHDIDYLMITYRLMRRDYKHLAKRLVPIGDQIGMSLDEKMTMLERKTRRFTEEEIRTKFGSVKH